MKKKTFQGLSWDSIFLMFVKVITIIISIIITKILSTTLSLTEYGTYSEANIIVTIGTSIIVLGLGDGLNYFFNSNASDKKEVKQAYVNTIFVIEIVLGIIFSLLIIIFRDFISNIFSNALLSTVLIIISFKPVLDNLIYLFQILYVSIGKAKVIAFRNFIISIIKLVIIIVVIYLTRDIAWIFACLILLDIFQLLVFNIHFGKVSFFVNPFKYSLKLIKPILKYSIPMGIYAIVNVLTRETDKLVISILSDTETLAIYSNCSKILPFDIVGISFATVLMPHIMNCVSRKDKEKSEYIFSNYLKIGYYSTWILASAVLITYEQMILFLYSEEFIVGKYVFIIYIIDSMIKFASVHLILAANKNTKELLIYACLTLLVNLLLNIALYYPFGMLGPAIATLVSSIFYMILMFRKSTQIIGIKMNKAFDFKELSIFIITLVITGVGLFFFNKMLISYEINEILSMIITIGLLIVINLLINFKRILKTLNNLNSLKLEAEKVEVNNEI